MNNSEFQAHTQHIERLVQRVTELPEGDARNSALELLQSVMDLHGAVVSRMVEILSNSDAGRGSLAKLAGDPLICGMLVLYGVHPVALEDRISGAIELVRPKLQKQAGTAELIGVADGVVRLRIQSSGHGCGSSPDALRKVVEQAILEAAPEVVEIVVEGASPATFVPVNMIQPAVKEGNKYEESAA
jgi:Fe-S cluster biogenesis protein NfuA